MKNYKLVWVFTFFTFLSCQSQNKTEKKNKASYINKVNNYLNKLEEMNFSGAVLLDIKGEKKLSKGYGFSDRESQIKNTSNTVLLLPES